MTTPDPNLDDVITPQLDKGVPRDRGAHGGSPEIPDGLMEHQADLDRRAAAQQDGVAGDDTAAPA